MTKKHNTPFKNNLTAENKWASCEKTKFRWNINKQTKADERAVIQTLFKTSSLNHNTDRI